MEKKYLEAIYKYKCMTVIQLYKIFYKNEKISFESFLKKIIYPAIFNNLIEITNISESDDYMIFLKTIGLNILKTQNKFINYTSKQLKISQTLYKHQIELVNCCMNIENYLKGFDIEYEVFNDKQTYILEKIIPDGLIRTQFLDIFIEIDMGTEGMKKLDERLNNYSNYAYYLKTNRKILVLFVMYNSTEKRYKNLFKLIYDKKTLFLSDNIEFSIVYPPDVIENIDFYIHKEIYIKKAKDIFTELNFCVINKNQEINEYNADFYSYKTDNEKKLLKNIRPYHFLIKYCPYPYSIVKALNLSPIFLKKYLDNYRKDIHMLIFVPKDYDNFNNYFDLMNNHYSIIVATEKDLIIKIKEVCI